MSKGWKSLIVVLGIVLGQAVLYGPSLIGKRLLLPLDILAGPDVYLPRTPGDESAAPHDFVLSDLVFFYEPERRYVQSEIGAGRLPFWTPHRFAGAPNYQLPLSPLSLLSYLIASPVVIAWTEMFIALVAGLGAYSFFRRISRVSFWPAAIIAWCYPLTGAYIIWQGYWLPMVMCWLPWLLLATDSAVRRRNGFGGPSLAATTVTVLISGGVDIAGQALIASGIYAILVPHR